MPTEDFENLKKEFESSEEKEQGGEDPVDSNGNEEIVTISEKIERKREKDKEINGNESGLKGIILKPGKVAKVVDIDSPDKVDVDGITYGVENPLHGRGHPALLIYNENNPRPLHHDFDPKEHKGRDGRAKYIDYSSYLIDNAYLENKMEQLSGIKAGGSNTDFLRQIWAWMQANVVNLLLTIFALLFILNVPWSRLLSLL